MNTKIFITCIAGLFWLAIYAAAAQQTVPEVIDFDGATDGGGSRDTYRSIYSGPVKFTMSKHVQDYGAACGDCHHDRDGKSIESHDPDTIYACGKCHKKEVIIWGPTTENDASAKDRIAHRSNAIHMQCIGCHQMYNDLNRVVRVAESCKICHAKHPQDWVIK